MAGLPQVRRRPHHGIARADGAVVGARGHHDLQRRLRRVCRITPSRTNGPTGGRGVAGSRRLQYPCARLRDARRGAVVPRQVLQLEAPRCARGRVGQSRLQPGPLRGRQGWRHARHRRRHHALGIRRARPARERIALPDARRQHRRLRLDGRRGRQHLLGTTSAGSITRASRSRKPSSGAGRSANTPTTSTARWKRSTAA
jgi:hypothetical protein